MLDYGMLFVEGRILGQKLNMKSLPHLDRSCVRKVSPGKNSQQRGFAAAVDTDDADPVAVADSEREIGEYLFEPMGLGEFPYCYNTHTVKPSSIQKKVGTSPSLP
jgi:hypothetical protein